MKRSLLCALLLVAGANASAAEPAEKAAPPTLPATPKRPVSSEYGDLKVSEDYRWLEDAKAPEVRAWADAQNLYARTFLSSLPSHEAIAARVAEIAKAPTPRWGPLIWRGGQLFALESRPPKQQSYLVVRKSADGAVADERVLFDPASVDAASHTAIDWFMPSQDGKLVGIALSKNGSERGDLHIIDVASGKALPDVLEHVQNGTAGGSIVFTADNSGLFYTRYPRKGDAHADEDGFWQQVWFHKLGTPATSDVYCFGKELPRIAEIVLSSSDDGKWFAATVSNGDGGEHLVWLRAPDGKWAPLSTFADEVKAARFGAGSDATLYLKSTKGAPKGQVLALPLGQPLTAAKVIVPASEGAIQEVQTTATRLWTTEILGGPTRLRSFRLDGSDGHIVATPPVSNVAGLTRLDGDELLAAILSYLEPLAWYRFAPSLAKPQKTALAQTSPVDFSGIEARRDKARSKDGTEIPFTLICKKGTARNGKNPLILTGYGGYGISQTPGFNPGSIVWLERGGIIVIANLRGGGEFGEAWHQAGKLTRKQNVFDDFIAIAKKLVADKWTRPSKLGIQGGSNGGLLMGAVVTQQPQLFGAVISGVGMYDMLRVELSTNGAFNVTEFGTVKDPAQRNALYAYSPYHHVVDGTAYPPMLMTTGDNDPRVDPMNSRKMTARLQAATSSKAPILLRTSASAGHGMGTALDERVALSADMWAFFFAELGVTYKPLASEK